MPIAKKKLFSFSVALAICISVCVMTACNNSSDEIKNIVKNIDHIILMSRTLFYNIFEKHYTLKGLAF